MKVEPVTNWRWLTTPPGPADKTHGADAGQRGWKRHLVYVPNYGRSPTKNLKAVCGLRKWRGWSCDLFIDDVCSRCEQWVEKRGMWSHVPDPPYEWQLTKSIRIRP